MLQSRSFEIGIASYLADVDAALPGLVGTVYATGSIALGDFRPACSDIDLVAVCPTTPTADQVAALSTVHRPSRISVDVLYVTPEDLRADPTGLSSAHSLGGRFFTDDAFAPNPVTWRELQTIAVAVRGPQLRPGEVWFDPSALRSWNLENLDGYWTEQVVRWKESELTDARLRDPDGLPWLVLGVPRLHHTIATLEVTSKTGAGQYALTIAPRRWHSVIEAALRLRADPASPVCLSLEEARRQAKELCSWLIEDAHRIGDAT